MRVNIDLDEDALMKLFNQARVLGRSRKRHMEMILEDVAKSNLNNSAKLGVLIPDNEHVKVEYKPVGKDQPYERAAIEAQIAEIEAEKIPPERNTSLGRKSWQIDQASRIAGLRKLLD